MAPLADSAGRLPEHRHPDPHALTMPYPVTFIPRHRGTYHERYDCGEER